MANLAKKPPYKGVGLWEEFPVNFWKTPGAGKLTRELIFLYPTFHLTKKFDFCQFFW